MAIRLADLFTAGQEGRQAARDDQARKGLASYLQGDQSALGSVYQNAPEVAFRAEGMVDERRKTAQEELGRVATAYAQTPDPMLYGRMRMLAQGTLGPQAANMPETLASPTDADGAKQFAAAMAQAYGKGMKEAEQFTLSPGSARYDAQGKLLVSQPFAPEKPDYTWDSTRAVWIPKPGNATYGGATSNPITGADFGIGETNDYVRNILGKAGQIDPNAPPDQQADALLPHLIQQESGGNPNAVSPKGAQGLTQVMPATARDPGFGVTPMRDGSPQENVRFGREYLTAMLKRYPGRPDLALAAYNAGPGVADRFAGGQASAGSLAAIPVAGVAPKADEDAYSLMTPEEVQAIGLPAGTVAQRNPKGGIQIINKPRDLPTGGQVIDNGDGTTTYIPAGKVSEGERNAAGFYQRMVAANAEMKRLDDAGYDPSNRRDYYTAGGEYLNPLASTEGRQYRQAQDNWLRANLRKESGAAIGAAEMDQERKNYFPIPGDDPETIAQKARNREVTERAMRQAAGGALAPPTQASPRESTPGVSGGGWSIKVKP